MALGSRFRNTDAIILIILIAPWLIVIANLYRLQVVQAKNFYQDVERIESGQFKILLPRRGTIFVQDKDQNLYPIALSVKQYSVFFNPRQSKDQKFELKLIRSILPNLNISERLERTILLQKDLPESSKRQLAALRLDSLFFEEYYRRYYPETSFLSSILGFAAPDEQGKLEGKYGLEKFYEHLIGGHEGYQVSLGQLQVPQNGQDIILNIDYFVQRQAENILAEAVREFGASGGMIIVARPNGQIITLAEQPNFNPNSYGAVKDYQIFRTNFVQNYEPGSVMKAFTCLSAIDHGVFKEEQTYNDTGMIEINGWKITNFDKKGRGVVTLAEALEQSLNTGAIYVERLVGHRGFLETLRDFKFDRTPEIDLPNLAPGNLDNLYARDSKDVNFATASFGHGISVSPAHLLLAMNTIANDGRRTPLRFLNGVIEDGDLKPSIFRPQSAIFSSSIINQINHLLERVVQNGSGKLARTPGFRIGGKTGSAFIPDEDQPGYSEEVINTFMMSFPLSKAQFTVIVRIDRPDGGLARVTTVPPAKQMIDFLINYYNIQPDNPEELIIKH